jgi:hypothetical protein
MNVAEIACVQSAAYAMQLKMALDCGAQPLLVSGPSRGRTTRLTALETPE